MARIRSSRKPAATLPNVKRPSGPVRTPMLVPAMVTSAPTTGSLVAVAVTVPSTEPVCAPSGRAPTARPSVTATYKGRRVIGAAPVGSSHGNTNDHETPSLLRNATHAVGCQDVRGHREIGRAHV